MSLEFMSYQTVTLVAANFFPKFQISNFIPKKNKIDPFRKVLKRILQKIRSTEYFLRGVMARLVRFFLRDTYCNCITEALVRMFSLFVRDRPKTLNTF